MFKKLVSVLAVVVLLVSCLPVSSYATVELDSNASSTNENAERASGLITSYAIDLNKTGNTLEITGHTYANGNVVRTGFKTLTIEYRTSSSASWEEYVEYTGLYDEDFDYNLYKTVEVESGYQYRITCVHYAKKNILSVEKIENVSNIV